MVNNIKLLIIGCIVVACCVAERRNPLKDPQICGRPQCDFDYVKFGYRPLVRYKYDYSSHVRSEFHGTGQNTSDIVVLAAVTLTFPKDCEGVLKLSEIELRENPIDDDSDLYIHDELHAKSSNFAYELEKFDLRFAFHDGVIGELCPNPDESNWAMNFKRGILSTIQNSMKRFDIDYKTMETDVSGACDVNYVVNGALDTSLLIRKSKDITTCLNRYKTNSILQTTPYEFRKKYSAWPILNSTSYCDITIDHNIYQEVACYERHQVVPFSNNENGAVTISKLKLTLADEESYELMTASSYDEEEPIKKREPLLYNHYPTPKPKTGEIKATWELLKEMCNLGFPDIKRQFIDVFSKFLHSAKSLSTTALHELFRRGSSICSNNWNGKYHILESLPYIGSTASVQMMINEIINKSVDEETAHNWLESMSFLPRPDEEMLEALYRLLEHNNPNNNALFVLTPTTVVHTYCRHHSDCSDNDQVKKIADLLEQKITVLFENGVTTRINREKAIVYLKGIGNIGIMSKSLRYRLREIIQNDEIPTEVRLQTVLAHRRGDCVKNRDFFMDIYRNFTGNSEIRIASYLEIMRCPDYICMKHIKYILKNEEVNQVGSFVWSHLKNTAKSASPVRVEAQGLLVDDDLGTKYRLDMRKFSHNFEHSLFFDEYNVGASADANLIFGTNSYMPRSASFNFTVDLFGESINIFEVNTYLQGFEHMVEGMFGPKGPLSKDGFSEKLDATTKYFRDKLTPYKVEYFDNFMRMRRDTGKVKAEPNNDDFEFENENSDRPKTKRSSVAYGQELQNDVNDLDYKLKYNMNNPRASFGLKMFGNDIKFKTLEGLEEIGSLLFELNPQNQIKKLLSGNEIIYTKSGVFLKASYEVPLSSGFPLSVEAYGASSIDLRMLGSFSGESIWPNPKFAVKGKLKPSISLDVVTTMQSDYFYGSIGVRVKNNLYSSSSVETNFTVDGKNFISLQFGLPKDRNQIISAKSELFVLQYKSEIKQAGIQKRYTNSTCTWPAIERAVGLKFCSDYSLPDVSKSPTPLPSLLLCGPINVKLHVDKADLSAKTYLFEYQWIDSANRSTGSLIFETPNSIIPRRFAANIIKEPSTYNLSMSFINGRTIHSAIATYKNTDDEKMVEAHLKIDGEESFTLEMGMNKSEIQHGWLFYPRFSLAVNNKQIARLEGNVKKVDKRNIIQHDLDITFHTNKFETGLKGFIVRTGLNKYTTRLGLNYKFENNKMEFIELDSEFGDKTDRSDRFVGMLKWNTTAYPKYNFKTDFNYTHLQGHVDLGININNAVDLEDPKYNLGMNLVFIRKFIEDKAISRTLLSLKVVRPVSKLNTKFMVKYESRYKIGLVHNVQFSIRYAKHKETTAVISIMLPSEYTRNVDLYLNVTVPSFGSCSAQIKATQRKSNQYDLRMYGAWFTNHSVTINGIYEDKSSAKESYHHLKLVVKSPYLNETNIVTYYILNDTDFLLDTRVDYGKKPYALVLKHSHLGLEEQSAYAELKILNKLYSLSANLNNKDSKRISIDLHIEGVRDIQIVLRGQSTPYRKEAGIEIKWDANRDDTQKLALTADFNTPKLKVYDGGFTVSYPDRTFSGSFDLVIPGPEYRGNISVGWSANDAIHLTFDAGSMYGLTKNLWLITLVQTPFDGWHTNGFNWRIIFSRNYLSTNTTLLWADTQQLGINILADYDLSDPNIKIETKFLINSTIKDVPTIDASFKHNHNLSKYYTDISIRHAPQNTKPNLYAIKSIWHLNFTELHRDISGSVSLKSPLKGYKNGALSTKFKLSTKKLLQGAAQLELEGKKFTLAVEGVVKRLTDCMLQVNVTTPIEKYRTIIGRFGLIDRDYHVVAELRGPTDALGIEIKFDVNLINDFDIIFNLETPSAYLQKAMIIGKLKPEMIDFRGGFNKMVVGYVAVSRKVSLEDFEYSWKIYTPLPKFKESSLVVKFIRRRIFDLEIMLKLAQNKLGIIIDGKPKQKFVRLPSISSFQFESRLADEFDRFGKHFDAVRAELESDADVDSDNSDSIDSSDEFDEDDDDDWNFVGHMELETITWPTISGNLDVDDIAGEDYIVTGNLLLPHGSIDFRDHLYFPDLLRIKNALRITTPYTIINEIELLYLHSVKFDHYYNSAFEVFYKNQTKWIELGYNSNYSKSIQDDERSHDFVLNLLLPFESIPRVTLESSIEVVERINRVRITAKTIDTSITLGGSLEREDGFIDINAGLEITSPIMPDYAFKVNFTKDFSDVENSINIGFEEDNNGTSNFRIETTWHTHTESSNYIKLNGKMITNIFPIAYVDSKFFLNRTSNFNAEVDLSYVTFTRRSAEFHLRAQKRKQQFTIEFNTPLTNFANLTMTGSLIPLSQPGKYNLIGKLIKNFEIYNVDGTIIVASAFPVEIDLQLKPVSRSGIGYIIYSLKDNGAGYGKSLRFKVMEGNTFLQINGVLEIYSKLNWNLVTSVESSPGLLSKKVGGNKCNLDASLKPNNDGKLFGYAQLKTPWRQLGIDKVTLNGSVHLTQTTGDIQLNYDLSLANGRTICSWTFIVLENIQALLDTITYKAESDHPRSLKVGVRFINPGNTKQRLTVGGIFDVDSKWHFETNGSLTSMAAHDTNGVLSVRLPEPLGDIHRISGRYEGDVLASPLKNVLYEIKYESDNAKQRFASRGQYRNVTDLQTYLRTLWGTDTQNKTFESNVQMLRKGLRRELSAKVQTPFYIEDTISASGYYDKINSYYILNGNVNFPASRPIGSTHLEFASFANVNGFVNCSTPYRNVSWLRTDLNYSTAGEFSRRYIKTTWPSDFAYFDLKSSFNSRNLDRNHQGTVDLEVPVTTRHVANIEYSLKERQLFTNGHCNIIYNKKKILNGQYECKSESRAGFNKDSIGISLDNDYHPIGITYVHQTEKSKADPPLYFNFIKHAEIYALKNTKNRFNITGELHVRTTATGQAFKILAAHPNRTVIFTSDYDFRELTTHHRSKLELAQNIWIAYDLRVQNLSTLANDSQVLNIDLSYPKRNLSTSGWYSITEDVFDSDFTFKWTKDKDSSSGNNYDEYDVSANDNDDYGNHDAVEQNEERSMRASLKWSNEPLTGIDRNNQTLLVTLRHPSFTKDVTLNANYYRSSIDLVRGKLVIDYHDDPEQLLTFVGGIKDYTTLVGHRNYSIHAFGLHDRSELSVNALASIAAQPGIYETKNFGLYKRGYLPLQEGLLNAGLNMHENDLLYHKVSPYKTIRFWARGDGAYPIYTINGTFEDSPDVNTTSEFYINIDDRFVRWDANFTPDASQNLRMLGIIPDARSASFDLWRDYEDIRIVDISYYLRMNHSRLITTQLLWRPKLKSDIKDKFRQVTTQFYDTFSENIDFWLKTLYTESSETISDVWSNAKPSCQEFLDDLGGLSVIEKDFEEFRIFLNQSYEANDFYVKTVVNFTMNILDELAIRNHIDSVPKILNEIWIILGDSGTALRKNVLWFVEAIKTSYKKAVEVIGRIFHGEALSYVSVLVEKAVITYDKLIKDLHLSFIKYVQNMWNRLSNSIMDYWRGILDRIQPSIMKFFHYTESVLWNISQEILDFVNKRTNEIVESQYYDTISKFTQDLDRIYQDIQTNDAFTNLRKYSALTWAFLKDKYFKVVPFGKELQNITNELIDGIKQLEEVELVKFMLNRWNEWEKKLEWLAEEFQLDKRAQKLYHMIYEKIKLYGETALQMDDKYREAKTNFIFDPDSGIIKLEQKLPMSWHAFNETPLFEEISEFRRIGKIFRLFNGINVTFGNPFEQMQYYTNPYMWLPPFKSRSLLVGSRHYISFDKRIVSLNHKYSIIKNNEKPDQCSYLLAHDFVDLNFTLIQEPSVTVHNKMLLSTRKLALVADKTVFDIDMIGGTIRINRNFTTTLPMQIGDTVIYRDSDILVIRSNNGFELNCNLQFDLCWFQLSGWYYGKTAGILGTVNNEIYDDFLTSKHLVTQNENVFKESWALKECKHDLQERTEYTISNELLNICDTFFRSKISQFVNCFSIVDSLPFYEMCLDMGANSISNFTHIDHPAQKGACAVALGYIETCADENIPLRVPDICVHCDLSNGSYVAEGHMFELKNNDLPRTTDIVFIVEAKPCNEDLIANKNLLLVLSSLNKELNDSKFSKNRYAVIAFGGEPPFDEPYSIVYKNEIFTDYNNVRHYFDHIKTGNGNSSDISRALKVASDLVFRPGVSKTFILLPCTNCNASDMRFDYSSILQTLLLHNINLHIFMEGDFDMKKPRFESKLFGFDRSTAFTSKYLKDSNGEKALFDDIQKPKQKLGFCLALATESNGSIFAGNKLRPGAKVSPKKFTAVFAKRVVHSAVPNPCQMCECTGHNTGIAYITCTTCDNLNTSTEEDYGDMKQLDFDWDDDYQTEKEN